MAVCYIQLLLGLPPWFCILLSIHALSLSSGHLSPWITLPLLITSSTSEFITWYNPPKLDHLIWSPKSVTYQYLLVLDSEFLTTSAKSLIPYVDEFPLPTWILYPTSVTSHLLQSVSLFFVLKITIIMS